MSSLVAATIFLQGLVPLVAILLIAMGPERSRASWLSQVACAGALLAAVGLSGPALAVPWYLPRVMAGLLVVAVLSGARRIRGRWPASRLGWMGTVGAIGGTLVFLGISGHALRGRRPPPGEPVTLSFPMEGRTFLVASGGSNSLVNPHLRTLSQAFRAYRGQSFAIDLVAVGRWGSRSRGLTSSDPADYAVFGTEVRAPCDGTVVRAFDEAPDMPVPVRSRDPIEGNHVILDCGGIWVVMAHLQSGTVGVAEGQTVATGSPIGRVGNSGQSDEPHLHIHAQTPGSVAEPLSGEPLPVRFGAWWPVRNGRTVGGDGSSS